MGIIDGYDPDHYAVKVRLQPENVLTGWLPLASPWVGDQWGMYCGPSLGDVVDVHFQQGDPNAAYVEQRFFSTTTRPLPVPSKEFWLVDASGSYIKLKNDGTIQSKATWQHTGDLNVTGNITATEDITDQTGTTNESMQSMRTKYNGHVHPGVQPGSGETGTPDPTM
jgi:uncharacterized protein involved in type VI secretion and phage assembly